MAEIGIEININGYETMTWCEMGLMGEFDISVNDTYGFPQDPHVFLAAMLEDYALDYAAQQGLANKRRKSTRRSRQMLNTTDDEVIQQAYTYVLATLQDEAVNVPTTNIREITVFNLKKIESVRFPDDPTCCDVCGIVLK